MIHKDEVLVDEHDPRLAELHRLAGELWAEACRLSSTSSEEGSERLQAFHYAHTSLLGAADFDADDTVLVISAAVGTTAAGFTEPAAAVEAIAQAAGFFLDQSLERRETAETMKPEGHA